MSDSESKAKIVSVKAFAEHGETGKSIPYKKFLHTLDPSIVLGANAGGERLKDKAILAKLAEWDIYMDEPLDSYDQLRDWLEENADKQVKSDNTYNWSWWGPTLNFTVVSTDPGDPYSPCIILARAHRGGDVRGNYGAYHVFYNEQYYNCFYPWRLVVIMKTSDGQEIVLESEDDEAYRYICRSDDTGTLEQDSTYKRDDIIEAFEVNIRGQKYESTRKDPFEAIL